MARLLLTNKLVIIIGILIEITAFAQCPDYSKLQESLLVDNYKNSFQSLKELRTWEAKWATCKFKKDSLYGILLYKISTLEKNPEHALRFANQGLMIFQNNDTKISSLPKIHRQIGWCIFTLNDYKNAKLAFEKAIKVGEFYSQREEIAKNYRNLSYIYLSEGDYESALLKIERGLSVALKTMNRSLIAQLYIEKGNILRRIQKFEEALQSNDLALKNAFLEKDKELIARSYELKGRIHSDLKSVELSVLDYEKALLYVEDLNPSFRTTVLLNIGFLYLDKLKQFDEALKYFNEALNLSKDSYQKLLILDNIAYTLSQKKQFLIALETYQEAFKQVNVNFNGNIKENPKNETLNSFSKKTSILTLMKDKAGTWVDFYNFDRNKSHLRNALNTYLTADRLIDVMRFEHIGTQSKFFWRNKTRSIYESAIETCFLLKDYEKAFYFFEKSRSVLLNDKLNELGAKQKLSEVDFQKEKFFLKQITDLNASIEKASTTKQKSDLNNKLLDSQEKQDRFIKSLETKNPAYYQMKYDTTTVSLKQFQNYLSSFKGQAVEYFIGDSATYAIVVSPNSVSLKKLSYNTANTQQFLDFCSKNINTKTELSQFLKVSSGIYRSLVLPLNLQKGRLIISQDGAFMPFEALSKSVIERQYLLDDFIISYTYSAQFLLRNTQKSTFLPQNKFLGIAPVNYNTPNLNSLKGSAESLDNIAKRYFWSSKCIDEEGTKKAFLTQAKNHQIVQIYTHAFADSNDTEPQIYFADSTLKISDLNSEERFKTNLLVLSACKTGVGKVAKGEGVLSLARGFSMLGIPATITSLWSIEDKNTYTLTELFYQYLNQGLPKDEALQKAKIEFIEQNEGATPYTWAGMILIGDTSSIASNYWIIWLIGVLLLSLLSLIIFRRVTKKSETNASPFTS